jgi:hypothetical protein
MIRDDALRKTYLGRVDISPVYVTLVQTNLGGLFASFSDI